VTEKITRSWWPDLLALVAFAGLTVALARGHLLDFDQRVADWVLTHQPAAAHWLAVVLNFIGPAKIYFDRAAPKFTGPEKTVLFNPFAEGKYAMSYPSGHMGNVLVWYAVMAILIVALLGRQLTAWERFALRVAPVVIVFVTTVYLGYHWVTDSVAGVLLGVVLARLIERVPWDRIPLGPLENLLAREQPSRESAHQPGQSRKP
jgi:membrane-associated phospholipid phosphatase